MKSILTVILALACAGALHAADLSPEETGLVQHVKDCIACADEGISDLSPEQYQLPGLSSPKVRELLNNLCTRPNTHYLEVGLWAGSTFVSALFRNEETAAGIGIDNWSDTTSQKELCLANCAKSLKPENYTIQSIDCFASEPSSYIKEPVTLFYYDADPTFEAQKRAFTHFNSALADLCVIVVDDWNWDHVREGTQAAFKELGYQVLYDTTLAARYNKDVENWWNGLYVAVVRKPEVK